MRATSLLLLVPILCLVGAPAQGDVVRLKTGESVKGRIVPGQTNDSILVMEDYLTGAMRVLGWDSVIPEERTQLRRALKIESGSVVTVTGVRITQRLDDGSTAETEGVIVREDNDNFWVQTGGQVVPIPKRTVIGKPEAGEVDAREVYSPRQLWEQMIAQEKKDDPSFDPASLASQDHFRLAVFAEDVSDFENARTHYRAACEDKSFLRSEVACQRLARVEDLLRDKEAFDTLKEIKGRLSHNLFARVRVMLGEFLTKHANVGPGVTKEYEKIKTKFAQKRTAYFQRMAGQMFVGIVEDLIQAKLKEKNEKNELPTITDVTSWTRRELPDAAFLALAEVMKKRDPDVTADEAKNVFWAGRPKTGWRRLSYDSGTFIVNPPKIKPPKARQGGGQKRNPSGGPQAAIQIPKPPTRDEWWVKADFNIRARWVLAFFCENSELFEVGAREKKPCSLCNGEGLQHRTTQTGDVISFLCLRCGGAQMDEVAKVR